jgi:hypothetical protein
MRAEGEDLVASPVTGELVRHYARAIDQNMHRLAGRQEPLGEGVNRQRIEQIHRFDLNINPGQRRRRPMDIARWDNDSRTRRPQLTRSLPAKAGITARNDCGLTREVDAPDDLGGGRGGIEAGTYRNLRCGHGASPDAVDRNVPWQPSNRFPERF